MLLNLNQRPGLILGLLGAQAFGDPCAGVKVGVFESVRRGPYAASETTVATWARESGQALLLNACQALVCDKYEAGRCPNMPKGSK